jgi:hypothetical protein
VNPESPHPDPGQTGIQVPDFPNPGDSGQIGTQIRENLGFFFATARTVIAHCQRQARLVRFLVGPWAGKRLIAHDSESAATAGSCGSPHNSAIHGVMGDVQPRAAPRFCESPGECSAIASSLWPRSMSDELREDGGRHRHHDMLIRHGKLRHRMAALPGQCHFREPRLKSSPI